MRRMDLYGQGGYAVRTDWGPAGALACAADLSIVIDVLSFSTSVTIATARGTTVYPCPWRDPRADALAARHDAVVAVGRLEATRADGPPRPSLSPAGMLRAAPVPRLVLPSPNGSTIASLLRNAGSRVGIGCLRNASAVVDLATVELAAGRTVALIAAGERWAGDGSLRPALEDHLGAGAVADALRARGHGPAMSPETLAAADLFAAARTRLREMMRGCVGGRELASRGFADDVDVAAEVDADHHVPVLRDGCFPPADGALS